MTTDSDIIKVFFSENNNFKHFYVDCKSWKDLSDAVKESLDDYPHRSFRLFWIDKEGDEISIDNERSYKVFIRLESKYLKVYCELTENNVANVGMIYECGGCDMFPITGNRFRCLECPNFDLCSRCETNQKHKEHVLVKYTGDLPLNDPKHFAMFLSDTMDNDIHIGIECDNCGAVSFRGFRYKCIKCYDYDLCSKCQDMNIHSEHPLLRIPTRRRAIQAAF